MAGVRDTREAKRRKGARVSVERLLSGRKKREGGNWMTRKSSSSGQIRNHR